MLDEVVQRDIATNEEYRRAEEFLSGNHLRYKSSDRYAKELAAGLRKTVLAEYDLTLEDVKQGAIDAAEQNARYLLGSSPAVKVLGVDRVLDLQEVVEYACALQEPNTFILKLGQEYVVSALKTLYERVNWSRE